MSEHHASTLSAYLLATMATLVGDYSGIVLCALVGTLWPLGRTKTETRFDGALLVIKLTLTSAVFTGLIAWLIETKLNVPAPKVIGTVALFISAMGDRWQAVFDAIGNLIVKGIGLIGGRQ